MRVSRPVQGTGRPEGLPHAAQYIGRMEQKKRSHVKCRRCLRPCIRLLNRIPDFAGMSHLKIKFRFGQGLLTSLLLLSSGCGGRPWHQLPPGGHKIQLTRNT